MSLGESHLADELASEIKHQVHCLLTRFVCNPLRINCLRCIFLWKSRNTHRMPTNRRSCVKVAAQHMYLINFLRICFFYRTIRKNNQQGDLHLSHRAGVLNCFYISDNGNYHFTNTPTPFYLFMLLRIHRQCDQIGFVYVFGRLSVTVKNNSVFNQ